MLYKYFLTCAIPIKSSPCRSTGQACFCKHNVSKMHILLHVCMYKNACT